MEEINPVIQSEEELTLLMSSYYHDERLFQIVRYHDKELPDMYDHNYFYTEKVVDSNDYNIFQDIKDKLKEDHLKVESDRKQPMLIEKGMKESITLTMIKDEDLSFSNVKPLTFPIAYKNVRSDSSIIEEVIKLEIEYYGKDYGVDFCRRRWVRYFNKIKEGNNGLELWAVCKDNKVIAYAYTYYNGKVVSLDGLLTIKECRNKGVASNLIKHMIEVYKCPIFLHAEDDDEPKILYQKLGFKTIYKTYEYLSVDKQK